MDVDAFMAGVYWVCIIVLAISAVLHRSSRWWGPVTLLAGVLVVMVAVYSILSTFS